MSYPKIGILKLHLWRKFKLIFKYVLLSSYSIESHFLMCFIMLLFILNSCLYMQIIYNLYFIDINYYFTDGLWNTSSPQRIQIATNVAPISKMVLVEDKLWCSTLNSIAIINTASHDLEVYFYMFVYLIWHF